jgi:PhzF family phenazine biosynthesis protein
MALRRVRFVHVDVFTRVPFGGNQLAVFPEADELTALEMQTIAREMNFSESTFVLAGADSGRARVRIFTPGRDALERVQVGGGVVRMTEGRVVLAGTSARASAA